MLDVHWFSTGSLEGQVSFGRKNNVHGQFKPYFYIMSNVSLGKISDFKLLSIINHNNN